MSVKNNELRLVHKYFNEVIIKKKLDRIDHYLSDNKFTYISVTNSKKNGRDFFKSLLDQVFKHFPDAKSEINELYDKDGYIVLRSTSKINDISFGFIGTFEVEDNKIISIKVKFTDDIVELNKINGSKELISKYMNIINYMF